MNLTKNYSGLTRVQLIRRLRAAEQDAALHRLVMDVAPVLIAYVDSGERYRLINATYETWYGLRREEILGRRVQEVVGEEIYARVGPSIARVLAGELQTFTGRLSIGMVERDVMTVMTPHRATDGSVVGYCFILQEITELRREKEALQRSEERLRAFADATFEGIVLTRQGVILGCNPQLERMLGFTEHEMRGRSADEFVPPEHRERVMVNIRQGHDSQVVHDLLCRDGSRITVEARGRQDENLGRGHRFTVIRDITEQLRAEAALLQNEELLRCTLQALPAHIAVIGSDGRIVEVNQAWADFAQGNDACDSPQVAVGADYLEIVRRAAEMDDPYAISAIEGLEAVLNGTMPHFSMEYPCHSPREHRWFLMTALPLNTNTGGGLVITHLNITERKQAEDSLRESEERYRSLVSTSLDAVLLTAPDGRILLANEAAGRMFGCTPDELCRLGREGVVDLADPRLPGLIAERSRAGRVHGELTFVRVDGSKFPGEVSSVVFLDCNDEIRSSMVIRDISERKQVEAGRLTAMARQRDTLVREVHHRIKNHLQGVSGMLRGMVSDYPESARPLEVAIDQVRAIAQVYGLQSTRDDARVRLCDLLRTSAENMIGPIPVVCHLPSAGNEAILAPEEAVPLALVVNELLTNAIKHIGLVDPACQVMVVLDIGENVVCSEFRSSPACLPLDFDFARRQGIGTGLELVAALLPPRGATLVFHQEGNEVVARLVLESPVISAINRAP